MSSDNEENSENKFEFVEETTESKQDKMADESVAPSTNKSQIMEPCRTPIERSLLAHFFFIFAASFILGVIFLHSSLTFWSWQVNEINEYGGYETHYEPPSETFLQKHSQLYPFKTQKVGDNVLTIILSPNMTLSLER